MVHVSVREMNQALTREKSNRLPLLSGNTLVKYPLTKKNLNFTLMDISHY